MKGLMQDRPLLITHLIEHAAAYHSAAEIVTLAVEGGKHRYSYRDCRDRSKKVAQAMERTGMGIGDRIATLALNTYRHMELWYGIAGMGAVAHTINPRLFAEQIVYIVNHAEDRILFLDIPFIPLVEAIADKLKTVERYVVLTDDAHMPETKLPGAISYESLIAAEDGDYEWREFDERTASGLCYTSGTTGHPKGVLYSHRSTVLHAFGTVLTDTLAISAMDSILPIVPMFHASAWGIPYSAAATGAKLVMPGMHHDGETLQKLITEEGVTMTAGVPTVWLMLLNYLEQSGAKVDCLERVLIGGAAAPQSMIEAFEKKHGVRVFHAWGMTEMSPLGTVNTPVRATLTQNVDEQIALKAKQGRAPFGVDMKITDDDNGSLPWDGKTFGNLKVRGPWVAQAYFRGAGGSIVDEEGWFDTGDVATIDEHGFMQITDRSKDVIKSGGEWISSIELESAAMAHPAVAEAAVIGIPHPKWDERPLLVAVIQEDADVAKEDILDFLKDKIVKWWMPDDIIFVEELPHTATGKVRKATLREQFADYTLPAAQEG